MNNNLSIKLKIRWSVMSHFRSGSVWRRQWNNAMQMFPKDQCHRWVFLWFLGINWSPWHTYGDKWVQDWENGLDGAKNCAEYMMGLAKNYWAQLVRDFVKNVVIVKIFVGWASGACMKCYMSSSFGRMSVMLCSAAVKPSRLLTWRFGCVVLGALWPGGWWAAMVQISVVVWRPGVQSPGLPEVLISRLNCKFFLLSRELAVLCSAVLHSGLVLMKGLSLNFPASNLIV